MQGTKRPPIVAIMLYEAHRLDQHPSTPNSCQFWLVLGNICRWPAFRTITAWKDVQVKARWDVSQQWRLTMLHHSQCIPGRQKQILSRSILHDQIVEPLSLSKAFCHRSLRWMIFSSNLITSDLSTVLSRLPNLHTHSTINGLVGPFHL